MSWGVLRRLCAALVGVAAALAGVPARAADALAFADIAGWWAAEPAFAGESSRVLLHFVEDKGKQTVRLSMLAIGGYDVPIGTVKLDGDGLDMEPLPFPLRYDRAAGTLSGFLPEAAVPVYRIPVEFRRIAPMEAGRRARLDVTARRACKLDASTSRRRCGPASRTMRETGRLFVATDAGMLHAIDIARCRSERGAGTSTPASRSRRGPAVIGDSVYVVSDSGFLHKLDKQQRRRALARARSIAATSARACPAPTRRIALGPLRLERRRRRHAALRRQPRQAPLRPRCRDRQGALARRPPAT